MGVDFAARFQAQKNRPKAVFYATPRCLLFVATGHFALHALDVEVQTTQELVVGHIAFFQHLFAGVVDDGALPDGEAAELVSKAAEALHGADLIRLDHAIWDWQREQEQN